MDTPLSQNPISAGWVLICGVVVVGATLKEVVGLIADSRLAISAKRPSLRSILAPGCLRKGAVDRIGGNALALRSNR